MARYFISTNASRNYTAGGISFKFEPVALRGGSWLGVLALDEESEANILLGANFEEVAEINFERFDSLKKKEAGRQTSSHQPLQNPSPPLPGVAGVVGHSTDHGTGSPVDLSKDPNSTANVSFITLLSAPVTPPHEPLLEQQQNRRPRPVRTK